MANTCELSPATWIAEDGSVQAERRRPGRVDVHPSLIPLLRGEVHAESDQLKHEVGPDYVIRDDLGPAVGISRWLAICLAGWGFAGYLLLR